MQGRIQRVQSTQENILPRIGMIKTGFKDAKGIPRSVDHFIATGNYNEFFHKEFGKEPQKIEIVFISDDFRKVCNEELVLRDNAGKRIAYGDGVNFKVWSRTENKGRGGYVDRNIEDTPDLHEQILKAYPKAGEWKETLTLNFIIPRIRGIAGQWQYSTHGAASTIPTVREAFDQVLAARGFVKGIIFDMTVKMHVSNAPDSKSRYPVVNIVPNMSEANVQLVKNTLLKQGETERAYGEIMGGNETMAIEADKTLKLEEPSSPPTQEQNAQGDVPPPSEEPIF